MKRLSFFIPLVFLLGCSFFEMKNPFSRNPASDPSISNLNWVEPKIDPKQKLTYQKFKNLMLGSQPFNMEIAIKLLGERYPEYMQFYTLMYNSFSLHESSDVEPRVIVFGTDARFIVSFNGNAHQRGGTSFEVIEYSEKSNEFEFRELTFKKPFFNREDLNLTKEEIEFENPNMVLSKANPFKCQECHLATNGPTWQNSFVWPGAYGGSFNNLYLSFDRASRDPNDFQIQHTERPSSVGFQMALREGIRDREVEGMISYLKGKKTHPRYKWLPDQISDAAFLKYDNKEAPFSELDLSKEYQAERERLQAGPTWPSMPNLFFQQALMRMNSRRIIARLKSFGVQQNAFADLPWNSLEDKEDEGERTIDDMATRIQVFLSKAKLKKGQPSFDQIKNSLTQQLRNEMGMQIERFANQRDNFGSDSLRFIGDSKHTHRKNLTWIGNSLDFYKGILSIKRDLYDYEKMAMATDSENQVMLIALDFLLLDRGMDIEDSVLTPRQFVMSFYRNGLTEAMRYLGYDSKDAL